MRPFFSIAIPTYEFKGKGVEFLEFSFEKIKKQTFKDFEVVISDHSLDDNIQKLCEKWKTVFKINYLKNSRGRGSNSPNINVAMENCSGLWIKILFHDDFLFDEYSLETQANFIKSNQEIIWFFTNFYHTNTGHDLYRFYQPNWNEQMLSGHNTLGAPSGLTLKNENIIFFDEDLCWLMDCDYYHRMKNKYGPPKILRETTYVNRTSNERLTDTLSEEFKSKEFEIISKKYA
jgi:glycosyltransferase involved in cell wall biosynthesis